MVGSYNEAQKSNGHYGSNYSYVPEWFFFAGIVGYDVRDYSEAGKNQNVYFGMAEESKEMLIENWVSSSCRVKEGCV